MESRLSAAELSAAERTNTVSQFGNLCAACHYAEQRSDRHCVLYEEEPRVCLHLRIHTRKLQKLFGPASDCGDDHAYELEPIASTDGRP